MPLGKPRNGGRVKSAFRAAAQIPLEWPRLTFTALSLAAILFAVLQVLFPKNVAPAAFVPLLVAAGLFLTRKWLIRSLAVTVVSYVTAAALTWQDTSIHPVAAVGIASVVILIAWAARSQLSADVPLSVSSGMVGELRERLDAQAEIPTLKQGYGVESCVMPAHGGAFSGDFLVASRRGDRLSLALTDVSGHDTSAATRALLLSGALSGLLGELEPQQFLPAVNRYLIRQGWRDGFASSIHVCLDMATGNFCLGTAGHPSAAQFHADIRRWQMVDGASGLLLGLFDQDEGDYTRVTGVLQPGDLLLLYSDGVVEGADGDLTAGTHHMLAIAQNALNEGLEGASGRICAMSAQLGGPDDRSAVVIWREPVATSSGDGRPIIHQLMA